MSKRHNVELWLNMKTKWNAAGTCLPGVLFLMLMLPSRVKAQFSYSITNGAVTITRYTGSGGVVSIPSQLAGFPVTSIGASAFFLMSVTSVTVPSSVTSIGSYAFEDDVDLTSIYFEGNAPTCGIYAFETHSGGNTTAYYNPGTSGWDPVFNEFYGIPSVMLSAPNPSSSLQVTIIPDGAAAAGAYWQVDGGIPQSSGATVLGLTPGNHSVSFSAVDGYTTPGNESVVLAADSTLVTNAIYVTPPDQFTFATNNGSITITEYIGPGGDVTMPNTISGLPVTGIGEGAFVESASLTSITIPGTVTNIADWAFGYCSALTGITIPNGVTSIGPYAFYGCSDLASAALGSGVGTIGEFAFAYCPSLTGLTVDAQNTNFTSLYGVLFNQNQTVLVQFPGASAISYVIPSSVTTVGAGAFAYSSLTGLTVPGSVTNIEDSAFAWCLGLTSLAIPGTVVEVGDSAFAGCYNLTSLTISNGVLNLGDSVFSSCFGLTSVAIPDTVTNLGNQAFWQCDRLTSVTIGDGVASIGDSAFSACSALADVAIPGSVKNVGNQAFYECVGLTNVTMDSGVLNVEDNAFSSCTALARVTIPGTVTNIGSQAFNNCARLASVTIPGSVSTLGDYAFGSCSSLTNALISNGVISIGDYAFDFCPDLTSIVIPASVESIGDGAFDYCSGLTSVIIGNGVTAIGDYAFYFCSGLASVAIPGSVATIGASAFGGCTSLRSIAVNSQNGYYSSFNGVLFNEGQTTLIEFPCGVTGSYAIPGGVTNIGDYAFGNCSGLTNVTIGNGVTAIGDDAFSFCTGLVNAGIPAGVTSIGDDAFEGCSSLKAIAVNAQNEYYSSLNGVLFNKSQTTLIQYPGGIAGGYVIPGGVTNIADDAFSFCTGLTGITIPNSVTRIGETAFNDCGLSVVTIPGNVVTIEDYAFYQCASLAAVYFLGNAPDPDFDLNAFANDYSATAYFLAGTGGWGSSIGGIPAVELPVIDISASPTNGVAPLPVSFTSSGVDGAGHAVTNWNWNFGDGATATNQNPAHAYTVTGIFIVSLTETNGNGVPIAGSGVPVDVLPLEVLFTAAPVSGGVPLAVSFTAASTDTTGKSIKTWNWYFGDGATGTAQNPVHTYTNAGTFFPSLVTTNINGRMIPGSTPVAITAIAPVYSGLVLNGDFETEDFTGWTLSGDASNALVDDGSASGITPFSGEYGAALGNTSAGGFLSQTLSTKAGTSYLLSFWFENPDEDPGAFSVSWNGVSLFDSTNLNSYDNWTNMQFAVSATGNGTVLEFGFEDAGDWFGLDDISVIAYTNTPPPAILSAPHLAVGSANFIFQLYGPAGSNYVLQASTNLLNWHSVSTSGIPVSGSVTLSNAINGCNRQFYRIYLQ